MFSDQLDSRLFGPVCEFPSQRGASNGRPMAFGKRNIHLSRYQTRHCIQRIQRKDLPAHKAGRLWKFRREEVDAWVRSCEKGGEHSGQRLA